MLPATYYRSLSDKPGSGSDSIVESGALVLFGKPVRVHISLSGAKVGGRYWTQPWPSLPQVWCTSLLFLVPLSSFSWKFVGDQIATKHLVYWADYYKCFSQSVTPFSSSLLVFTPQNMTMPTDDVMVRKENFFQVPTLLFFLLLLLFLTVTLQYSLKCLWLGLCNRQPDPLWAI